MSNPYTGVLGPEEATKEIRSIVKHGSVLTTSHCRLESMRKRNITFHDLLSVLQNGTVIEDPIWDERYENFKCKVEGTTIDDGTAIAITVFLDHRSILVITIY